MHIKSHGRNVSSYIANILKFNFVMAYLITGIRLGIDFYHTIFAAHFATAFLHGGR
jgi:hypothetical protein